MKNSGKKLPKTKTLVDRISDFPDELLCHILSFLDTKQAVATSILSKRWEFLWTYVDILDLSNLSDESWSDYQEERQYMQFVRRVLELHRAPLIKRMELTCYGLCYENCYGHEFVTRILTAISSKSVQSLHLYLHNDDPNIWPLDFFCSKTLVELLLEFADITSIRNSPTAPFFPNLMKLHLNVYTVNTASLARLISGCSILEDFSLHCYFGYDSPEPCCISSTTIKSLDLYCPAKPDIVLNTPALEVFKIRETRFLLLGESSMASLHKAHIYIYSNGLYGNRISNSSLTLFEIFSNVSVLCLQVFYKRTRQAVELDLGVQFHKLKELEIRGGPWICLDLLTKFMEKSNNLQVITLKVITLKQFHQIRSYKDREVIWEEPQHVPKCLLSSLHTIRIEGDNDKDKFKLMMISNEDKFELMMIKYFLGNAKVLKRMEIRKSYFRKIRLHMLRKILLFPRASPTCEISVN